MLPIAHNFARTSLWWRADMRELPFRSVGHSISWGQSLKPFRVFLLRCAGPSRDRGNSACDVLPAVVLPGFSHARGSGELCSALDRRHIGLSESRQSADAPLTDTTVQK